MQLDLGYKKLIDVQRWLLLLRVAIFILTKTNSKAVKYTTFQIPNPIQHKFEILALLLT